MKRFIIDFFLMIILVMIGSGFLEEKSVVDIKTNEFEENLNQGITYEDYSLENVGNNKATLFAQKSGETIEEIVGVSVELIASIFHAIVD